MKFKFPYENILKTKKVNRDVAFRDFAESKNRLDQSEQGLLSLYSEVTDAHSVNESCISDPVLDREKIEMLKWTHVFLDGQKAKIARQKFDIQQKLQETETRRDVLAEAGKDFKIFEKLKMRMNDKFKKQQKKIEQKTIDEMVVMRAGKKYGG